MFVYKGDNDLFDQVRLQDSLVEDIHPLETLPDTVFYIIIKNVFDVKESFLERQFILLHRHHRLCWNIIDLDLRHGLHLIHYALSVYFAIVAPQDIPDLSQIQVLTVIVDRSFLAQVWLILLAALAASLFRFFCDSFRDRTK